MTKLKAIILRRWPVLLAATILGMVGGYLSIGLGPSRETTQFQAEQVLVVNRGSGNPASVAQDSLKVNRGAVLDAAAEALGESDRKDRLARKIRVSSNDRSNSITLRVFDTDGERASSVVEAFAEAFLSVVNAELRSEDTRQLQQLADRVDAAALELKAFDDENGFIARSDVPLPNTPTIDALIAERRRLVDSYNQALGRFEQAELTMSQRAPYSTLGPEAPRVADSQLLEVPDSALFRVGLLGVIGLLLGTGLVILVERVNQRVDTREELAALVSIPIVAEIGRVPVRRRPANEDGRVKLDGVWSEHYRRVRSAIQFVQADAAMREEDRRSSAPAGGSGAVIAGHHAQSGPIPRVFLFASALPGEGKSTSTALTALALSEVGEETLVINADFRRPKVETYLGSDSSPSLADRAELAVNRPELEDIVHRVEDHLWLAPGGPPTQEVSGRLQAVRELAAEAASRGGTVLIDSSPLRVSNDPIDLLAAVDEVILVVRAGITTVKSLEDTIELLEMHHAPTLGIVLIGTLGTREMYSYYQSYYYSRKPADGDDGGGGDTSPPAFKGPSNGSSNGSDVSESVVRGEVVDPGDIESSRPKAPSFFRGGFRRPRTV